jgi:hypothetical protein
VSAFDHEMKWMICILAIVVAIQYAYAQVGSGTIVVYQVLENKFIVAADSRVVLNGIPSDTNCKIAAFREQVIFTASGGPAFFPFGPTDPAPAWNAFAEAKRAILLNANTHSLDSIADAWASQMKSNWEILYRSHPALVKELATRENGGLTNGLFATATDKKIVIVGRAITFKDGVVGASPPPVDIAKLCQIGPCAIGKVDIFHEYIAGKSERAKRETWSASPAVLNYMGTEMVRIIRLADLTIAYDPAYVAGAIDALELAADGSIAGFNASPTAQQNSSSFINARLSQQRINLLIRPPRQDTAST